VLIVGDGSGSKWDDPCGWAGALIDKTSRGRRWHYGGMNAGSVNFAESMPYAQALCWYDLHVGKALLKQQGVLRVHIVTDSQTIANWGTRAADRNQPLSRTNGMIWAGMRYLASLGYAIKYHWARRMTSELNWAADIIAGLCRQEVMQAVTGTSADDISARAASAIANVRFEDPTGEPISPYELNRDS